jgi:hypothetical protein
MYFSPLKERPPTGGSAHLIINGGACSPRRVANGVCGSPGLDVTLLFFVVAKK